MNEILQLVEDFAGGASTVASANPIAGFALFAVEEAVKQTPALIGDLEKLFSGGTPSLADIQALRAKVSAETYAQFVPASAIPAGSVTPVAVGSVTVQAVTGPGPVTPAASQAPVIL